MSSRDRFNEGVWKYVIAEDDLVIGGVLYDGRKWESDDDGGVRERLHGDARIQRDAEEAEMDARLWDLGQKAWEDDAERDCTGELEAE